MRILVIYSYFCTPKGFWSTRWYEFARRWVEAGHKVQILSAPYEKSDIPSKAGEFVYAGIDVNIYNTADNNRHSKIRRAWNAVKFAINSSSHVLRYNYDVVIASSGPLSVAIPMIIAKKIKKTNTVFEVRDLWPDAAISMLVLNNKLLISTLHYLEKLAYYNADTVITCSEGQKNYIQRKFNDLNVECISNSSDSYLFSDIENKELQEKYKGKKLILHLGSLGFIHNCKFWVELATEMKNQKYHFVFIGDGNERHYLDQLVSQKGLQNIEFVGIIAKSDLTKWTNIAVASLFSTHSTTAQETCSPNKVFDSLEAGLPLIQTTKGWIADMVSEHKVGLNVDATNPTNAAEQLEAYLSDEQELLATAERAKNLAKSNFNRDSLSTQYLEILQRIVA